MSGCTSTRTPSPAWSPPSCPRGRYPWHYDTNEYVVTIMTQAPEAGGEFVYHQNLRSPGDENLEGLGHAIAGTSEQPPRSIAVEPGDLQLFLGRYSLHRVTEVEGDLARHVLVLSYSEEPGVIGPVDRTRMIKTPEELAVIAAAVDACEAGVSVMREEMRPGMTEQELWSHLHAHNIASGGE